jgi:hypothetical protein
MLSHRQTAAVNNVEQHLILTVNQDLRKPWKLEDIGYNNVYFADLVYPN